MGREWVPQGCCSWEKALHVEILWTWFNLKEMGMGIWGKSCVSDKCFAGRNHLLELLGAPTVVVSVQQRETGNIASVRKRLQGWKQAVPNKVAKTALYSVKAGERLLRGSSPDMTTVFHPWTDLAFVKIEDSSWGQKSLRSKERANHLAGLFGNRQDVGVPPKIRGEF